MDTDLVSAIDLLNDNDVKNLYVPPRHCSPNRGNTETSFRNGERSPIGLKLEATPHASGCISLISRSQ